MVSLDFQSVMSISDIQKYNGKNVEVNTIANLLFDDSKIVLIFRTAPTSTSMEVKLRALLKKNLILMRRIKRKTPKIILKLNKFLFLTNSKYENKYIFDFLK